MGDYGPLGGQAKGCQRWKTPEEASSVYQKAVNYSPILKKQIRPNKRNVRCLKSYHF